MIFIATLWKYCIVTNNHVHTAYQYYPDTCMYVILVMKIGHSAYMFMYNYAAN